MSSKAPTRISSLKILVGALAIVPLRFSTFAGAVAIPFVLCVGYDSIWLMQPLWDVYERLPWVLVPLTMLINLALYTIVAVATHRVILLGSASVMPYRLEWGTYTTRFLIFAVLFTAATYGAVFAIDWIFSASVLLRALVSSVSWVVLLLVWARLLLVFPATAVERPISLTDSWRLTRRRKLLMFLIAIVYPAVIEFPLSWIPDSSTFSFLLSSALGTLTLIVTVILLSFAYQQIEKEQTNDQEQ